MGRPRLFSHPSAAEKRILSEELADFCTRWNIALPEVGAEERSAIWGRSDFGLFIRWAESCGVPGLTESFSAWVNYPLAFVKKGIAAGRPGGCDGVVPWRTIVGVLLLIEQESAKREAVYAATANKVLPIIAQSYRSSRKRLRKFRDEQLDTNLGSTQLFANVGALKESQTIFRRLQVVADRYYENETSGEKDSFSAEAAGDSIRELLLLLGNVLDERTVISEKQTEQNPNQVLATELLDLRGIRGKVHFIMGLTAQEFPAQSENPMLADFASGAAIKLLRRSGAGEASAESIWLLGHLVRSSRELVITIPACAEGKEVPQPALLIALQEMLPEKNTGTIFSSPPPGWMPKGQRLEGRETSLNKALVAARHGTFPGAYEGDFFAEEERWKALSSEMFPPAGRQYSLSELELMGD